MVQMSQALVKIAAVWLLGLMLAVAGAIVSINLVNDSIAGPQQPVREYLSALQKGDGEKALVPRRPRERPCPPRLSRRKGNSAARASFRARDT